MSLVGRVRYSSEESRSWILHNTVHVRYMNDQECTPSNWEVNPSPSGSRLS